MTPPKVSIVVTAYDEAPQHLRDALASALGQTVAPIEVVVVDDGSPRDHGPVLAEFPSVRVVRQTNQGLAAARNTGWRAACGTHVVFLDADDRLTPDALAVNLRRFAAHPDGHLMNTVVYYKDLA